MARHMYIRLGLILYVFVPLIEAKQSRVFCWVMWATVCSPKGSHHLKKIYFAKKFHKTVTPPPVGVL